MKKYIIIISLLILFSCSDNSNGVVWKLNCNKDIKISDIVVDTIKMDKINSSCVGETIVKSDSIYFIDKRFCWVFSFDMNGKLGRRYLGKGSGPSEINTGIIDGYSQLTNGGYLFVGAGNDCHLFSENFERKSSYTLNKGDRNKKDIDLSDFSIYTLMYPKLIFREYNGYVYFNQYCEHPSFDFTVNKDSYRDSRLLSRMDIRTGNVDSMYGRYPNLYSERELNQFSFFSFDISKTGDFYCCFEADSLIYKYDKNFNPLYAFGYAGREMNTDYLEINSYESLKKNYSAEREKKSYYDWIEYIDELDLVFRTYKRESKYDGLQIYNNSILIADLNVPKGFRVSGYIKPYIYSNVKVDEESEEMEVYRFKMPDYE